MEPYTAPKKNWLDLNIGEDSSDEETQDHTSKQQTKFQKIYDVPAQYSSYIANQTARDKFSVNRVQRGFFVNETDAFQFDTFQVKSKPLNDKESKEKNTQQKSQDIKKEHHPTSLPFIESPQKSQNQKQEQTQNQSLNSNSPDIKFQSETLLAPRGKMFHLDLSSSQEEISGSDQSDPEEKDELGQQQNPFKLKINQNSQPIQDDKEKKQSEKSRTPKQDAREDQMNPLRKVQSKDNQKEFKFDQEPQHRVLDQIQPQQTVKAMIIRTKSVLNVLCPDYEVKIQSNGLSILNLKKQTFSFENIYKIFSKTVHGKNRYFGKISANFKGTQYQIFTSQDGFSEVLRAQIYFPTSSENNSEPRYFIMFVLLSSFNMSNLVTDDASIRSLRGLYRFQQNRDKIQLLQTRKPVFVKQIQGFVLNFNGRVNMPSIKNFILEDYHTKREVLMFGKVGKDQFRLQISSPLNCVLGASICMVQFQNRLMQ